MFHTHQNLHLKVKATVIPQSYITSYVIDLTQLEQFVIF